MAEQAGPPAGGRTALPRLYPVSDRGLSGGLTHVEIARRVAAGGATLLQLREKSLPDRLFLDEIRACVALGRLIVIVNDRPDLALAGGAAGVHLGDGDLPPEEARRLLGPGAIIGLSTHSVAGAIAGAARGVDYVALGPVFATGTKRTGLPSLGVVEIQRAARGLAVPLVAIGGITLERAPELWRAGAASVASISDIMAAGSIEDRVRAWVRRGAA